MNNELLLLSGNDIPFVEAQLSIHNPTIKEIALISEETFFSACQILNFSKESLSSQDKIGLEDKVDFEILMSILGSKEGSEKYKDTVYKLLTILFPGYLIKITKDEIFLAKDSFSSRINKTNYDVFKDILVSMFCLNEQGGDSQNYNTVSTRAAKIAEKLQKAKEKKAAMKGKQKIAFYSRYVSILAVGEQKDMNILMNYTPYQLQDELTRYQKKMAYDVHFSAQLAGATNLDDVDNWMDDIHP